MCERERERDAWSTSRGCCTFLRRHDDALPSPGDQSDRSVLLGGLEEGCWRDRVTYAAAGTSIIHQRRIHLRQIACLACALNVGYNIMNIYIYIYRTYDDTSWVLPASSPCSCPCTALSMQQPRRHVSPLGRPRRDLLTSCQCQMGSNNLLAKKGAAGGYPKVKKQEGIICCRQEISNLLSHLPLFMICAKSPRISKSMV